MSISKTILYTSDVDQSQKVSVSYTCNDDLTDVSITDYTITGISDAKYPKFSSGMEFKDVYVDSDATLVSATGFEDGAVVLSVATDVVTQENNAFSYLNTSGSFILVAPCAISVT